MGLTRAEQLYLTLGRSFGWSPEECVQLVEDYQDDCIGNEPQNEEEDQDDNQ